MFLPLPLCLLVLPPGATSFAAEAAFSSPQRRVALVFFSLLLCSFMPIPFLPSPHGPHINGLLGVFIPHLAASHPGARA